MYQVLIADDHAIVRNGLSFLINQQPNFHVCGEAANGTETFLLTEEKLVDILVLDLSMPPGESGLVTEERIHRQFPKVKIIVLSMHEEQEYIDAAMHNGGLAYVLKSSPDSELIKALKTVANNKPYLDGQIRISKAEIASINREDIHENLNGYENLSKREVEVLPLVALGFSNKEIATKLFISTKTVEAHKAKIMSKLHLKSRVELIRYAVHHKLIDI